MRQDLNGLARSFILYSSQASILTPHRRLITTRPLLLSIFTRRAPLLSFRSYPELF